jgi:hypothetical protein
VGLTAAEDFGVCPSAGWERNVTLREYSYSKQYVSQKHRLTSMVEGQQFHDDRYTDVEV